MGRDDDLRQRVDRVIYECGEILEQLEVDLGDCSPSCLRTAKAIEDTVNRLKKEGLPVPTDLTQIRLDLVVKHGEFEGLSSLLKDFREKIESLLSHPAFRNSSKTDGVRHRVRERQGRVDLHDHEAAQQFEISLPPAFIKWGGFSVNHTFRNLLPPTSTNDDKHLFVINVIGYGEVEAWMSQDRIKLPSRQFRQVMAELDLQQYSRLRMKIRQPFEYYELSKIATPSASKEVGKGSSTPGMAY